MIPLIDSIFLQRICSDEIYNRHYRIEFVFGFENQEVGGQRFRVYKSQSVELQNRPATVMLGTIFIFLILIIFSMKRMGHHHLKVVTNINCLQQGCRLHPS